MESKFKKPVSNFPKYAVGIFLIMVSFFESQFLEKEWLSFVYTIIKGSAFETQLFFTLLNFIPNVVGLVGIAFIVSATGYDIFGKKINE